MSMNLTLGANGDAVQQLQEQLAERGYDVGEIDGHFGRRTKDAVASFQREHELEPTGTVGPATAEELDLDIEVDVPTVPPERAKFTQYLAENPNFFGNQPELDYEPEIEKVSDTSYEALNCVGYDPGAKQLEAIVSVKRDYGYGGDLCEDGSVEFVRFFIDRQRNGNWEDLGVGSANVHDMPGPNPIDYAITIDLDEDEQPCGEPFLPRIRAVLSWNHKPPAGKPDFRPVWGNRLDADIQIEPDRPTIADLIDADIPDAIIDGIDAEGSETVDPPKLGTGQLLTQYQDTSVPPHRGGFSEFRSVERDPAPARPDLTGSSAMFSPFGPDSGPFPLPGPFPFPDPIPQPDPEPEVPIDLPPDLDIDVGDVLEDLAETTENTGYEELGCVGYRQGVLTGVFTVKRPSGYSGGLCTQGSTEYVAFWEKDVSGGSWNYLGTGSVSVYDIPSIPGDGLQYAVHLPADLSHHRTPCHDGPGLARIRAVLSWDEKPPASKPHFAPTWGNQVETIVQVPPGPESTGEGRLAVGTIGDIYPSDVEQRTGASDVGTVTGPAAVKGFQAKQAPFGGLVTITGRPMDGLEPDASGNGALKYRVMVRPYKPSVSNAANPWQHVTNEFRVRSYDAPRTPKPMTVDNDGFYTYVPKVINDVLAKWYTSDDGLYELKIEAKRGNGDPVRTDVISAPDGTTASKMLIKLDNTGPEASIEITGVFPDGTPPKDDAGDCGFFNVGDTIVGEFEADDTHLKQYNLFVRPGNAAGHARVAETSSPSVRSRGGGNGTWELETAWAKDTTPPDNRPAGEMDPCGYTVHAHVVDNTIVNNSYHGHRSGDSEGFCLLGADQEIVGGADSESGTDSGSESDGSDAES